MPTQAVTIRTPAVPSLGLAFVFTGAGYAFPYLLAPLSAQPSRASEVVNLYCVVAWMGLSHFVFAYAGHARAVSRTGTGLRYLAVLAVSIAALFALRLSVNESLFNAVAWTYFIAHLLQAEMYFTGRRDWRLYFLPLLAFTYFSFAIYGPDAWITPPTLFLGAALSCLPLGSSSVRQFLRGRKMQPYFLVSMFLIGEALLWGRYRPYMTPQFRDGVYTVHVAIASFYHYFKSYAHMLLRKQGSLSGIVAVNFAVAAVGWLTVHYLRETPIAFVFGISFFTVWVWLHQWMSDAFNWQRRHA